MNALDSLIRARSALGMPIDGLSVRSARERIERGAKWRFDHDGAIELAEPELGPVRSFFAGMVDSVREIWRMVR